MKQPKLPPKRYKPPTVPVKLSQTMSATGCCAAICGRAAVPTDWAEARLPVCNRPVAYSGPHREYHRQSFALLAEWQHENCLW